MPPPRDQQTRARVEAVQKELARANALDLVARYDEGLSIARAALTEATALRYAPVVAEAQHRLGLLLGDHGDFADATRALRHAFAAALAGHHEEMAARVAVELIYAIGDRQAQFEEGEHWAELAEALVGRLQRKDEVLAALYNAHSRLHERESKYDEALADATAALALEQRTVGPDHFTLAETHHLLGNIYYQRAQWAEALRSFEASLAIRQRTLGPDHPWLATTLFGMANVYGDSGEHARAMELYQRALATFLRVQVDHPYAANIYNNIGEELLAMGRPAEASEQFQRAFDAWTKRLGPSEETTLALSNLGAARLDLGQLDAALRYFHDAQAQCDKVLGPSHELCGANQAATGDALRRLGQLAEAQSHFARSLAVLEKATGPKHPQLVRPLVGLGQVALDRRQAAAACAPLERALAIREAQPADGRELAEVRLTLAQALWATGDRPRALSLATQARDRFAQGKGSGNAQQRKSLADATDWLDRHR
jgi:tetratricopeptide (TPR) repeat protein